MLVSDETFRARLRLLARRGYPVLPLDEAVRRLRDGTLPACAVALTIDDGFQSTLSRAAPILRDARMPAMVYVTTYYTQRDAPVFRLAMRACFASTRRVSVDLSRLGCGASGAAKCDEELLWELINHGEQHLDEGGRSALLRAVASELAVDLDALLRSRSLHLMTTAELRELAATFDVQLHTHRHRLPADPISARAEIEENRRVLAPLTGRRLVHFCYPSGYCGPELVPALAAAGIETATTCEPGLNGPDADPLALRRFLDGECIPEIVLEAELCGLMDLARTLLRRRAPVVAPSEEERRRGYPAGSGRTILDRATPRRDSA
jgi:peptidoglycan/xylan/chitin deacetylase (PgdA/CDA1 family)